MGLSTFNQDNIEDPNCEKTLKNDVKRNENRNREMNETQSE